MIEIVNGSLMRVEPSGAWNQCGERVWRERVWDGVESVPTARWGISLRLGKAGLGGGFNWEKAGRSGQKAQDLPASSRHFPRFPTFSHLFPLDFFMREQKEPNSCAEQSLAWQWGRQAVGNATGRKHFSELC